MKQKQLQREEPPAPVVLSALISEPLPRRAAVSFKLTDECSAAINEAAAARRKIRLHHQKDACFLEVTAADGSTKRFECVVQSMGYPIDAVQYDAFTGQYQTISAINTKIQVRATDRTFAETREKAQKLVEEQQKHKVKDMNSKIHKTVTASSQRRLLSGAASTSSSIAAASKSKASAVSIRPSNALAPNIGGARNPPEAVASKPPLTVSAAKFGLGTVKPSAGNLKPMSSQESSVKTTSFAGGKPASPIPAPFSVASGPSSRIGYAPKNPPPTFRKRPAPSPVLTKPSSNVSEASITKPLSLMEVDTSSHKSTGGNSGGLTSGAAPPKPPTKPAVSQQQSGNYSGGGPPSEKRRPYTGGYGLMSTGTTNFVPASGAETMPAIQPTDTTPSPSPSSAASSIDSPNSNYGGGSRSHNQSHHQSGYHHSQQSSQQLPSHHSRHSEYNGGSNGGQFADQTQLGGDRTSVASTHKDRHYRGQPTSGNVSRDENWRRVATLEKPHNEARRRSMTANGNLTKETKPSCNYHEMFREIRDLNEAKRYHDIFATEYPEYRDCYEVLSRVASEFHELEKALKLTGVNTPDRDKMEDAIQNKFAMYQNDENFLQKRQRHTDLRTKLDVLKQRIIDWEKKQKMSSAERPAHAPPTLSDMMVM